MPQDSTPWYIQIRSVINQAKENLAAPVPKSKPTVQELLQKNPNANLFCDVCKHSDVCHYLKTYRIHERTKTKKFKVKYIADKPWEIKKWDSNMNIIISEGIYPCDKIKNLDLYGSCYCDIETRE